MIHNILYVILAAFGLGFLVFIHELGHYIMARRVGMTVEAFGIGFGKHIFTWKHKGVDWHLNLLPFGGYVRIAGMEKKGHLEPYQIPDGFYGKKPLDRIKVAIMGPLVNIVFALFAFTLIWACGGREKSFSEFTHIIGWVDPQSKLYGQGVRPGDEITKFGGNSIDGFNDLFVSSILNDRNQKISGYEIDYQTQHKTPFVHSVDSAQDLMGIKGNKMSVGSISPARYLIYRQLASDKSSREGWPLQNSGIQQKDRILSVDGQLIFSSRQLIEVINQSKALLTIGRGTNVFTTRIPRLQISDLRLDAKAKAELDDWQHAANLKSKVQQLFYIPYNLTNDCVVENSLAYIDENAEEHTFTPSARADMEIPLKSGDRILAVDGRPVTSSVELLSFLQTRRVHIIVERGENLSPVSWKLADGEFEATIDSQDLNKITQSIGSAQTISNSGNLYLLAPVVPKLLSDMPLSDTERAFKANQLNEQRKAIDKIDDHAEKAEALKYLEDDQKKLLIGASLQDREVIYNPSPFVLFAGILDQTWRTLSNLFTGYLNPKWMSGPVGIVQVIHYGWTVGVKEALFWMAVISLNLGILNLLPLPVLDGGHICFSLIESVTKKPLKAKTMERLIIPFVVILVGFFIFLTYNDIARLIGRFF